MQFTVLYQDDNFVFIDKPAGFFVHQTERNSGLGRVPRDKIILPHLRNQIGLYLYPFHRLDASTSGVLGFALNTEAAALMQNQLQNGQINKKYLALVRGYMREEVTCDLALPCYEQKVERQAQTIFRTVMKAQFNAPEEWKFPTHRYSIVEAQPTTGRYHQIRRHLSRLNHPVIGDREHGDSKVNILSRSVFECSALCLRAMEFSSPFFNLKVAAMQDQKWLKIHQKMTLANQVLPLDPI